MAAVIAVATLLVWPPTAEPADAPVFGRDLPGSAWFTMGDNYKRSSPFTLAYPGTVTDLVAYLNGDGASSGTQEVRFALYADVLGDPGALLATSEVGTVTAGAPPAWVRLLLTSPLPLAPGSYHLALHSGGTGGIARYSREPTADALHYKGDVFGDGTAPLYGSAAVDDFELAIYAVVVQPPKANEPPVVSGTLRVGETLSASTGGWANEPTAFAFEWRRCDATATVCTPIEGASGSTYGLVAADEGATVRVAVTASNVAGSATELSAPTQPVEPKEPPPPPPPPPPSAACDKTLASGDGSLSAFVASLQPGQTGCITGSFSGSLTISNGGFTLTTDPASATRATISGNLTLADSADGVTLERLDFDGGSGFSHTYIYADAAILRDLDVTGSNTRNCLLIGEGAETSPGNLVADLLIERSRIHDCGDDSHEHAIYAEFTERLTIRDSYLYASGGYGLHFYPEADDSLVEYTVIDGNDTGTGYAGNVTFSGEIAGGEYSLLHASDRNVIRDSIVSFASPNANTQSIDSYSPGLTALTGNEVAFSCVYSPGDTNFKWNTLLDYSQHDNLEVDPMFVNRAEADFTLAAGSPCVGKGPR